MEDNSNIKNYQVDILSKALHIILNSLFRLNKKVTFQIGFGTLAAGIMYYKLSHLGEIEKILISIGVFLVSAKIGFIIDKVVDKKIELILKKWDQIS